jgi:uncharacterized protein
MEGTTAPQTPAPSSEARNWAIVAHLGPIALSLVSLGILGWMVPLVVWLTQREANPFAAEHAKEALNFQILLVILFVLTIPLLILLFCIGIPAWIAIWLFEIVAGIAAAMRASDGLPYRYPLTPSFLG